MGIEPQWAKSPKKPSEGVLPYCQKYTPTDCFFGDCPLGEYLIEKSLADKDGPEKLEI